MAGLSQHCLASSLWGEVHRRDCGALRGLGTPGLTLPAIWWGWPRAHALAASGSPAAQAFPPGPRLHVTSEVWTKGGQMCLHQLPTRSVRLMLSL